jgi:hypothetical protein
MFEARLAQGALLKKVRPTARRLVALTGPPISPVEGEGL